MVWSWKQQGSPLLGKGQERAGRCFKHCGSRDSCKLGFSGTLSRSTPLCLLEQRAHTVTSHICPTGMADLRDAISLAYRALLRRDNKLSENLLCNVSCAEVSCPAKMAISCLGYMNMMALARSVMGQN